MSPGSTEREPMRVPPILRSDPGGGSPRLAEQGPIFSMRLPCEQGRFGCLEAFEQLLWVYRLAHPHTPAAQFLSFDGDRAYAEIELPDVNTGVEQWLRAVSGRGELLARSARPLAIVDAVPFADAARQAEALQAAYGNGPWEFRLTDGELLAPGAVALELARSAKTQDGRRAS